MTVTTHESPALERDEQLKQQNLKETSNRQDALKKKMQAAKEQELRQSSQADKGPAKSSEPEIEEETEQKTATKDSQAARQRSLMEEQERQNRENPGQSTGTAFFHSSSLVKALCYLLDEFIEQIQKIEKLRKNAGYNDPNLPSITSFEAFCQNLRFGIDMETRMLALAPGGKSVRNFFGEHCSMGKASDPNIARSREALYNQLIQQAEAEKVEKARKMAEDSSGLEEASEDDLARLKKRREESQALQANFNQQTRNFQKKRVLEEVKTRQHVEESPVSECSSSPSP
jgi:hypothetical protein